MRDKRWWAVNTIGIGWVFDSRESCGSRLGQRSPNSVAINGGVDFQLGCSDSTPPNSDAIYNYAKTVMYKIARSELIDRRARVCFHPIRIAGIAFKPLPGCSSLVNLRQLRLRGSDEIAEQRMRLARTALELGMRLRGDEPGMIGQFNHLGQSAVGG